MKRFFLRIALAFSALREQLRIEMADQALGLDHERGMHKQRLPGCLACDAAAECDKMVKQIRSECHCRGGHSSLSGVGRVTGCPMCEEALAAK